ncbi:hypothetical protein [Zavarzinella formosa]|uniref:hypothetical protein n=1 Tax=Zavarzinella formosa TaxID=360055 RepID=UPI000372BD6E|nr:hypothetical protein [Zavarzinella formosa]
MTAIQSDHFEDPADAAASDPSFDTPMPGQIDGLGAAPPWTTESLKHGMTPSGAGEREDIAPNLRARGDVELLLTKSEVERLLRQAVLAAESSPGWGPGREFLHEITDDEYVFDGFENSSFTIVHQGAAYDIRYYDGFSTEFIQ